MTIKLPKDLTDRGFRLIATAPGELFAVSECYGCTATKVQIADVVREARALIAYIEWRSRLTMPPAPANDALPLGRYRITDENTSIGTAHDDATD